MIHAVVSAIDDLGGAATVGLPTEFLTDAQVAGYGRFVGVPFSV